MTDWKPIIAALATGLAGVGGTIATQQGRVAREVQEQYDARIEDRVRQEVAVEALVKDVERLQADVWKMSAQISVLQFNAQAGDQE